MARRTISTKEPRTGTRAKMGPTEFAPARIPLKKVEGDQVAETDGPKPMGIADFAKAFPNAVPKPDDDPLADLRTYNDRCSHCGTDTIPLDPAYPNEQRVCLKCIIAALSDDGYDYNEYEKLEMDYDELQADKERVEDDLAACERTISDLESERDDLEHKLIEQESLNASMHESVDELQGKIDGWTDDTAALRNTIARLELDVERWKSLAMRKGQVSS